MVPCKDHQQIEFKRDIAMELKNRFFRMRGVLKTWMQPTVIGLAVLAFAGGQGIAHAGTIGTIEHDIGAVSKGMELTPQKKGLIFGDPTNNKKLSFLREPILRTAGFITPTFSGDGKIIKSLDEILAIGVDSTVYVDFGSEGGAFVGAEYLAYRIDHFVYHPIYLGSSTDAVQPPPKDLKFGGNKVELMDVMTKNKSYFDDQKGKPVGYMVKALGKIRIMEVAGDHSKALVTEAYEPIAVGDFLTPFKEQKIPDVDEPAIKSLKGYIVASKNPESALGDTSIVYLDRGSNQNVEPGDHFEIYLTPREGRSTFPPNYKTNTIVRTIGENPLLDEIPDRPLLDQRIGRLMVLATQPDTSTAMILESSTPIQIGQKVRSIVP